MKDEIKEILEDDGELMVRYKDNSFECFDTLPKNVLDYITNLQEENERLKEEKSLIESDINNAYSWLDDYKSRNKKAIDKIQYIIDYGFDYDGFNTVKSLKGLIDMLVDYARQSKDILQGSDKDER